MPETRYVYEYTDGVLSATTPYEVSDEQLAEEAALASTRALILDVLDDPRTARRGGRAREPPRADPRRPRRPVDGAAGHRQAEAAHPPSPSEGGHSVGRCASLTRSRSRPTRARPPPCGRRRTSPSA